MYCDKCNKRKKLFEKYCEDCGSKLTRKKVSEKLIKNIITTLIVILCFILCIFIGYYLTSPEFVAKRYFDAVSQNDVKKIYKFIDKYESDFVSEEILNDKLVPFEEVLSYKIVDVKKDSQTAVVVFRYTTNKSTKLVSVLLKNTSNYIPKWIISTAKIVEDVKIKVPANSLITIDNKDISKYKKEQDEFDIYNIPYMIDGEYNIHIQINDIEIDETIDVDDNKTYYISSISLESEQSKLLNEKITNELNKLYNSALSNEELELNVNLSKYYQNIKKYIQNNNIKGINITDIEEKRVNIGSTGKVQVTYNVNYSMENQDGVNKYIDKISVEFDYNGEYIVNNIKNIMKWKVA